MFEISCLSVASFAIIFSYSEGCVFTLLNFLCVQKLLSLIRYHYSGRWVTEDLAVIMSENVLPVF